MAGNKKGGTWVMEMWQLTLVLGGVCFSHVWQLCFLPCEGVVFLWDFFLFFIFLLGYLMNALKGLDGTA